MNTISLDNRSINQNIVGGGATFADSYMRYLASVNNETRLIAVNGNSGPSAQLVTIVDDVIIQLVKVLDDKGVNEFFSRKIQESIKFAQAIRTTGLEVAIKDADLVNIFHIRTAIGLLAEGCVDPSKTVIFPLFLGMEYKEHAEFYGDVPQHYIDAEQRALTSGCIIQSPSHVHTTTLIDQYGVPPEKIVTTPRGFDDYIFQVKERQAPKQWKKPIRVICANVINPRKGQHLLVPFASLCKARGIKVKILICGDVAYSSNVSINKYLQQLHSDIAQYGLEDYFEFTGSLSQPELNKEMLKSDVAIVPSAFETYGKTPLESSATGLPTIVLSDVLAYKEFLVDGESAIFSDQDADGNGLMTAFNKLISNSDLYHRISTGGIQLGQKYTNHRKLAETYKETTRRMALSRKQA